MVAPQRVIAALRIRAGAPSTTAPRVGAYPVGATIYPEGQVEGEAVAGNASWFQLPEGRFVWAGGCAAAPAGSSVSPAMTVSRRPDGTIRPLSITRIKEVFGTFDWNDSGGGRIEIERNWTKDNLVEIETPVLAGANVSRITVHAKARKHFERVFAAIADAGLEDRIRQFGGTWVARHMGWDPRRSLSSHSWGIAIDLNVPWNGYGVMPAPEGRIGSLREIVGFFEAEGFAWGGFFQPLSLCDGMHFELARTDF